MTNQEKLKDLRKFIEEEVRPKENDVILDHMYQDSCFLFLKYAADPYKLIVGFGFLVNDMRLGKKEKDLEFLARCFDDMKSSVLSHVENLEKKGIKSKLESAFRIFANPDIDLPELESLIGVTVYDYHPYNFYCHLIWLKMELPQIQVYYLVLAALWVYEERMSLERVG